MLGRRGQCFRRGRPKSVSPLSDLELELESELESSILVVTGRTVVARFNDKNKSAMIVLTSGARRVRKLARQYDGKGLLPTRLEDLNRPSLQDTCGVFACYAEALTREWQRVCNSLWSNPVN